MIQSMKEGRNIYPAKLSLFKNYYIKETRNMHMDMPNNILYMSNFLSYLLIQIS